MWPCLVATFTAQPEGRLIAVAVFIGVVVATAAVSGVVVTYSVHV